MFDFKKVIKVLSSEEIQKIKEILEEELKTRKPTQKQEKTQAKFHEFEFDGMSITDKKRIPYVAKLTWQDGKLCREFFKLNREYRGNKVFVKGKYKAVKGTVIEKRYGHSNTKYWYVVIEDNAGQGVEIYYTPTTCEEGRQDIIDYLKGKITFEVLITDRLEKALERV